MTSDDLKQKLIDAGLVLDAAGQGDFTRGHISVRTPDDPTLFLMKPHSVGFEEFTLDSIVTCNIEGEKVGGGGRRHSEVFIHSEILRVRPDVNAVIHAHPKYAIAFCATDRPWPIVSQPCALFAGGLSTYSETVDLIRSQETGAALARALGASKAVFMRAHGVAVTGASIEEAVIRLMMLERACEDQLLAQSWGGASPTFAEKDVASLQRNLDRSDQYIINFDYLVRRARRGAAITL
ncbi:class II aldolase/adducin family protein [Ancylobacter polymorphus]|uniref:L-fuculose-phosphate aldolase n=1 Tax=Ancylobacter polymorphus TaxID=223390 RepID=A0ABU0BGM3_9HYPH|nr:class II aldolase/adducin family protein [Ancylobacter polymorphus]MDQ0304941.1 L-fuculose-phosphate aldolase [Ancylobacter polymorphus]